MNLRVFSGEGSRRIRRTYVFRVRGDREGLREVFGGASARVRIFNLSLQFEVMQEWGWGEAGRVGVRGSVGR